MHYARMEMRGGNLVETMAAEMSLAPGRRPVVTGFKGRTVRFKELYTDKWMMEGAITMTDHPVYLFMELLDMREHESNPRLTYHVTVTAASPGLAGKKAIAEALRSCGREDREDLDERQIAEALDEYGNHMVVWQGGSNNVKALLREARQQATAACSMFGAYADAPQNMIGASGWQTMRGALLPWCDGWDDPEEDEEEE